VLDYVEFLRMRGGGEEESAPSSSASAPPGPDGATSWPGFKFAPDSNTASWDVEHPSGLDAFRGPPPKRHGGQIVIGIVFALVLGAVGTYLYLRFGRPVEPADGAVALAPAEASPAVAVAEDVGAPGDAGLTLPGLPAGLDAAAAPEAVEPVMPADAAAVAAEPDAGQGVLEAVAPAVAEAGVACGDAVGEARELWRARDREGALAKLREGIACNPQNLEAPLQWGRWVTDTPMLFGNRAACAAGAAALQPAAEANPNHGELWFHYTNLLFGSGQRDAALAAKEHCAAIRPRDEYSGTCRFLPQ